MTSISGNQCLPMKRYYDADDVDALRDALRCRINAWCDDCKNGLRNYSHATNCRHYATEQKVME